MIYIKKKTKHGVVYRILYYINRNIEKFKNTILVLILTENKEDSCSLYKLTNLRTESLTDKFVEFGYIYSFSTFYRFKGEI